MKDFTKTHPVITLTLINIALAIIEVIAEAATDNWKKIIWEEKKK